MELQIFDTHAYWIDMHFGMVKMQFFLLQSLMRVV
jgi:hypothetical protein